MSNDLYGIFEQFLSLARVGGIFQFFSTRFFFKKSDENRNTTLFPECRCDLIDWLKSPILVGRRHWNNKIRFLDPRNRLQKFDDFGNRRFVSLVFKLVNQFAHLGVFVIVPITPKLIRSKISTGSRVQIKRKPPPPLAD